MTSFLTPIHLRNHLQVAAIVVPSLVIIRLDRDYRFLEDNLRVIRNPVDVIVSILPRSLVSRPFIRFSFFLVFSDQTFLKQNHFALFLNFSHLLLVGSFEEPELDLSTSDVDLNDEHHDYIDHDDQCK